MLMGLRCTRVGAMTTWLPLSSASLCLLLALPSKAVCQVTTQWSGGKRTPAGVLLEDFPRHGCKRGQSMSMGVLPSPLPLGALPVVLLQRLVCLSELQRCRTHSVVLSQSVFITVRRHRGHSNSYRREHLFGSGMVAGRQTSCWRSS